MIKTRKMKISDRGLYLQDSELINTNFNVGSHYRYIIDIKTKKIIIVGSESESDNTVSKRNKKNVVSPVIDIRSNQIKSVLGLFKESKAEFLQVTITDNKIIIEEYQEVKNSLLNKANKFIKKITGKSKNVIRITDILNVKKISQIEMSVKQLDQAVGGYEQTSFLDYDFNLTKNINTSHVANSLKNLDIPLKILSLYSGAGLLDSGFKDIGGFEFVYATDISKDACLTYSKNIGNHIVNADITKLDLKNLPDAQVIIGGSPCVLLTNSNRKTNLNKKVKVNERILDIPENILLRKYIETVKNNKGCIVFVHENVGQINTIGEGRLIKEIKEELADFEITIDLHNASDYGTAQNRKRSIIVGSKIGKTNVIKPVLHPIKTLRQAFEGLTEATPNQGDYSKARPLTLERMKYVPLGGNVFNIPEAIRPKSVHSDYFKRLEWDKPSITIVNPRKSMLLHPTENRILSVRECARLQGLPDTFIFYGTLASMQLQVCNGVAYQLSLAIATKIKEVLANTFKSNKLAFNL
ncbi:DNA cytosine methyltransferase [Clostridium estertheticum]|uniref:DNA cytosine methyltransferase n=1 Tax=Clostridium estertheticum TaxID=238834 RepID=UPI001C0C9C0D|nr:DNA cytosine methyltransferase [Clostridium estertheticum]MBU3173321.1 DNA cytosine methyltransferase [Clostridium estertheticum]